MLLNNGCSVVTLSLECALSFFCSRSPYLHDTVTNPWQSHPQQFHLRQFHPHIAYPPPTTSIQCSPRSPKHGSSTHSNPIPRQSHLEQFHPTALSSMQVPPTALSSMQVPDFHTRLHLSQTSKFIHRLPPATVTPTQAFYFRILPSPPQPPQILGTR